MTKWDAYQGKKWRAFLYYSLMKTPGPSPSMIYSLWDLKIHERKMKTTNLCKKQSA